MLLIPLVAMLALRAHAVPQAHPPLALSGPPLPPLVAVSSISASATSPSVAVASAGDATPGSSPRASTQPLPTLISKAVSASSPSSSLTPDDRHLDLRHADGAADEAGWQPTSTAWHPPPVQTAWHGSSYYDHPGAPVVYTTVYVYPHTSTVYITKYPQETYASQPHQYAGYCSTLTAKGPGLPRTAQGQCGIILVVSGADGEGRAVAARKAWIAMAFGFLAAGWLFVH